MSSISRTALALALLTAGPAFAEPLVVMDGGKAAPGVITAWKGSGTKVELTVKAGADAKAVADAIQAGVPKVKAKVQGGKVQVTGKAEADLLAALAGIDFGGDDIGQLAAAAAGGEDSGGGSSLRAKKAGDLAKLLEDQATSVAGKVVSVTPGTFPNVVVTVQVMRGPTGAESANIKKNSKIQFKNVLKLKGAAIDWADEDTQLNAGAWYLEPNDNVRIKFGKSDKGVYEAVLIDRG